MSTKSGDRVFEPNETRNIAREPGNEEFAAALMRDMDRGEIFVEDRREEVHKVAELRDVDLSGHPHSTSVRASTDSAKVLAEARNMDPGSLPSLVSTKDSLASSSHGSSSHSLWEIDRDAPDKSRTASPVHEPSRVSPVTGPRRASCPSPFDYHAFYWECMELKSELIRLDFSLRSIGSAGPLIKATHDVKQASMKLRDLYGMNTSALFPEDENMKMYNTCGSFAFLTKFTAALNDFGDALDGFAHALHDFKNVYHDERLVLQSFTLRSRFKAEAISISLDKAFDSQPTELSERVQYMLSEWLRDAVKSLTSAVSLFIEKGIPTIQRTQENTSFRFLNMTTIAFFLSGTTASMLQVTADAADSVLGAVVNSCLFSSLVFSMGSAVNCLLAYGWRKSIVRDPDVALPVWLSVWLSAGPMISLLVSGAFFVVGVCAFVFTPGQHSWTAAITTVFTALHASGLMFLFGVFIQEKWNFRSNAGTIGQVLTERSLLLSGLERVKLYVVNLRQADIEKSGANTLEEAKEIGLASIGVDKVSPTDSSSEFEKLLQSPGVIYHALSDERFILPSKFVGHRLPSAPVTPDVAQSRSPSLHVPSRPCFPFPLSPRTTRRKLLAADAPTQSLLIERMEARKRLGTSSSSKPCSGSYSSIPPPEEVVAGTTPSDTPGRAQNDKIENQQGSNRLELSSESGQLPGLVPDVDVDRVSTDDDDNDRSDESPSESGQLPGLGPGVFADWRPPEDLYYGRCEIHAQAPEEMPVHSDDSNDALEDITDTEEMPVHSDDGDGEREDMTDQGGGDRMPESRSSPASPPQLGRLRLEPPTSPAPGHSPLPAPSVESRVAPSPVAALPTPHPASTRGSIEILYPRLRRRRSPSFVEVPRTRPQRVNQSDSSASVYGNVRSAAMFLPSTMYHTVPSHRER